MSLNDRNKWYGTDAGLAALLDRNSNIAEVRNAVSDVLTRVEEMALQAFYAACEEDKRKDPIIAEEALLTLQQQHLQAARERFLEAFAHLQVTTTGKSL